jgi:hypothetical protein
MALDTNYLAKMTNRQCPETGTRDTNVAASA